MADAVQDETEDRTSFTVAMPTRIHKLIADLAKTTNRSKSGIAVELIDAAFSEKSHVIFREAELRSSK